MHPGNINLHDWAEVYFEGQGWVPVDQSFGRVKSAKGNDNAYFFYTKGLDAYRMIVNQDISAPFYPTKIYPRSETVDFQRGEEWMRVSNTRWKSSDRKRDLVIAFFDPVTKRPMANLFEDVPATVDPNAVPTNPAPTP